MFGRDCHQQPPPLRVAAHRFRFRRCAEPVHPVAAPARLRAARNRTACHRREWLSACVRARSPPPLAQRSLPPRPRPPRREAARGRGALHGGGIG
eukprot:scaffold40166_cov32-Tisochrysis_lutea.AAC.3